MPVGTDTYGNRYYRLRGDKPERRGGGRFGRDRRWVIYDGEPEGSKVPSEWHAWLHHMVDELPQPRQRYPWEKDHQPNMTFFFQAEDGIRAPGHPGLVRGSAQPYAR